MVNFVNRVIDEIKNSGLKELTVIYNGSYYMKGSRITYARVDSEGELIFYNKVKDKDSSQISERKIDNCCEALLSKLRSLELLGQNIAVNLKDAHYDFSDIATVIINDGLQFLIIESFLYTLARRAIVNNVISGTIDTEEYSIDSITVNRMKSIFEINSYVNYKSFLDTRNSKKIIHRFLNRHKFYSIHKAFVPMFISIKGIYNPLLDNPAANAIKNSDIYKLAIEKNRVLDIGGYMNAYLLTHLEICTSLHLSNFMRFTPLFAYEVLVGLILPNNSYFPSNTQQVFIAPETNELIKGLKSSYSIADYAKVNTEYQELLANATQTGNVEDIEKYTLANQMLAEYIRGTTMKMFCMKELKSLTAFASLSIDEKVTAEDLNTYLLTVSLN